MPSATLSKVLAEVKRVQESKRDWLASTKALDFDIEHTNTPTGGLWVPDGEGNDDLFSLRERAHRQLAEDYKIPYEYYRRLRENDKPLLQDTVNYFLHERPLQRLVRTIDGDVRAVLSDRYVPRDNYDLMVNAILPAVERMPDADFLDLRLTEEHMYGKVVLPRVTAEVRVGDIVQAGFMFSNSEVGTGAFSVEVFVYRLDCLNGMVTPIKMRRVHTGRRAESTEEAYEIFSDQTLAATDRAFWLQARDIVAAAVDETKFQGIVAQLRDLASSESIVEPRVTVERVAKTYGFRDVEGEAIFERLLKGGDHTAYGLLNAITATAHEAVEDYDRQIDLERAAGQMLELSTREWVALAA